MKFTVIIPTRDRPGGFSHALASVVEQNFDDFEVVVVDDGSDPTYRAAYDAIEQRHDARLRLFHLPRVRRGHGPAYARNFGVSQSAADYVCFLDDDDAWIDANFLARVARVIDDEARVVDLHLSDQVAYRGDVRLDRVIWTEGLGQLVRGLPRAASGAIEVRVPQLTRCHGFCHLNTTVVRRAFFWRIGGFDESIRYESDRDFYLRAIDAAALITYSPVVTARHNVPVAQDRTNVSTAISQYGRHIFQLRLLNKAILFSRQKELREYGRRHKVYTLKHIAEKLWRSGDYATARYYAQRAAFTDFDVKWLLFYFWLWAEQMTRQAGRVPAPVGRNLYYPPSA
jgi:glycosyltransferase involved in cell wall biosynthesis